MAEGGGPESPPSFNEPEARYFSSAAAVGDLVFMYRGYLKSYQNKPRVSPPSRCEVFNTKVLKWDKRYTQGPNPKAWQSSSVAVFRHRLFYYGGWSGRDYTNELFELDTLVVPMKWMQHKPNNPKKGPRKKEGCGFIVLPGGEELCLFAGYGVPVGPDPPGTTSLRDEKYRDKRGWTNELHCYHLTQATWRAPEQTGQRPQPGVAMTFTRVDVKRIVVFAGYNRDARRRVNEVHILDISIWHWSGVILPQDLNQPWPEGRCYHTAYSLWDPDSDPQSPSLVVTCGWSEDAVPLGDLWVFQAIGHKWEELDLPDSIVPRLNHTGGLVHVSSTKRLLVTNGGIPEDTKQFDSLKDYPIVSKTVICELEYHQEAAAVGSCGWSVASVMKDGSKVTRARPMPEANTPMPEEIDMHRELEKALRMGYILTNITTCLASGAPGTGKTSLRHFIFNLTPPDIRISTACIEAAQRAILSASEAGVTYCKPVDPNELKEMVAIEVKDGMQLRESQSENSSPDRKVVGRESPLQQPNAESESEIEEHSDAVETVDRAPVASDQSYLPSSQRPNLPKENLEQQLPETAEILRLMKSSRSESRRLKEVHWLHFIDSGGQGEFLDMFPPYAHNIQLLMAVLKLSEKLDDIPDTEYFDHDHKSYQQLGQFTLTNRELLLQIAQFSLYHQVSPPFPDAKVTAECPKFMVVGTFSDQANKEESVEKKNEALSECLTPILDQQHRIPRSPNEIIFPVDNTKAGTDAAEPVASELRTAVLKHAPRLTLKFPAQWYLLELEIRNLIEGSIALGMSRCWEIAQELQFESKESLRAALSYLDKANLFFYYPEVFDGVINPEPVIEVLTKLYEKHASLHEKAEADIVSDKDIRFRSQAMFTADDIVQSSHDQKIIPNEKLMELFTNRLTVASLNDGKYFMPSLLRFSLEVAEEDPFPPEAIFIAFPSYWAPFALFCALIVRLLSSRAGDPTWHLNLCRTEGQPEPLYKNILKLSACDSQAGSIELINTLKHFRVLPSPDFPADLLPRVREAIDKALKEACSRLSYRVLHQFAFPCDCDASVHLATFSAEDGTMSCTRSLHNNRRASKKQLMWFPTITTSSSTMGTLASVVSPMLPHHHKYSSAFPGVCFLGDPLLEVVDSEGRLLSWPDMGITFTIPSRAVPPGKTMHTMVWPSLSGPFDLPEGYNLASPVYFVSHDSSFHEEVILSVAHFAALSDEDRSARMTFLASSSPINGKYCLKELTQESQFLPNSTYGSIRLKEFSVIAVGRKVLKSEEIPKEDTPDTTAPKEPPQDDVQYSVQLYQNVGKNGGHVVFAVTLLHPVYLQNLKKSLELQFPGMHFWRTVKQPVKLQENKVQLELPKLNGWDIEPDKRPCEISQEELDLPIRHPDLSRDLSHDDYPPRIVLSVRPRELSSTKVEESYILKVCGVSEELQLMVSLSETQKPVIPVMSSTKDYSHPVSQASAPIVTRDPQFPGIHFLGFPWKEIVTSEGLEISWEDIGVAFSIPPGAVPEDKEPLNLTVRPCLAGPFEPPDGYQFTSPVYIVSPAFDFLKDVKMVLFHSVRLQSDEDCGHMSFLSARSSPQYEGTRPQYKFKQLKGGLFQKDKHFASISLRHFCEVTTGSKRQRNSESDSDGGEPKRIKNSEPASNMNSGEPKISETASKPSFKPDSEPASDMDTGEPKMSMTTVSEPVLNYSVQLYRNSRPPGPCDYAVFCITLFQPVYLEYMERYCKEQLGLTDPSSIHQPARFAVGSTKVDLVFPSQMSHWTMDPDKDPPTIRKEEVDSILRFAEEEGGSQRTCFPRVCLKIRPKEGAMPDSISKVFKLEVVGLEDTLSFNLIPSVSSMLGLLSPLSPISPVSTNGSLGEEEFLGIKDLLEITEYLHPLVNKSDIFSLGLVLGLYHDRLKAVEQNTNFLDDVVSAWLRREGDVDKRGGPRWSTLIKALQHQRLIQTGIANTIAKDKLRITNHGGIAVMEL